MTLGSAALLAGALLGMGGVAGAAEASTGWAPVAAPQPPNQLEHELGSISCPTTTFCMTVGDNYVENYSGPLAETFDGTTWTVRHPPTVGVDSRFQAVSCLSATDCTVVGQSSKAEGDAYQLLAEHWDGTTWRVEPTPTFNGGSDFTTVSCPSASTCFASGSLSGGKGFFEQWQSGGKGWTASPISPAFWGAVSGISCASSTDCMAAGAGSLSELGGPVGIVEHWNGTVWTRTLRLPSHDDLFGISCASSTSCVVAGADATVHEALSVVLSGTTWRTTDVSVPDSNFDGVDCETATSCTAVGYAPNGSSSRPLVEHWNGSAWAGETVTSPAHSAAPGLVSVGCRGTTCDAVGSYAVVPVKGYGQLNLLVEQGPAE